MRKSDFKVFRDVMRGMGRLYKNELDGVVLDAYWLVLRDWTLDEFKTAAVYLMRTYEFMPRPAAFTKLRQAARRTEGEAWGAVLEHCAGAYRDGLGLDDGGPIDQAVAALGGYPAIARHNVEFLHVLERRFCEHYRDLEDARDVRMSVPEIARGNYRVGAMLSAGQIAAPGQGRKTNQRSLESVPEDPSDSRRDYERAAADNRLYMHGLSRYMGAMNPMV